MIKVIKESKDKILNEMARVGFTPDGYEIYVRTDDSGNIPHFHYWDRGTKGDIFHTCIRLDSPSYFHHTGKEDKLNSKQKKELVDFLESSYRTGISMWEHILMLWNDNNSSVVINEDTKMPNYMLL